MKKLLALTALMFIFCSLLASFVEGNVLFKSDVLISVTGYSSGVVVTDKSWFNVIANDYQVSSLDTLFTVPTGDFQGYYYVAEFDKSYEIEDLIDDLEKENNIFYAEPDHEGDLFQINTNDTYASTSWGLEKIGMNQVWADRLAFGGNVKVAVLDTGIDLGITPYGIHPDLVDNLWDDGNGIHGFNVFGAIGAPGENINIPQDNVGHGTHVCGIIGAATNNSIGVAGVAGGWSNTEIGCQIMPVRMASQGGLSANTAIRGIHWAYRQGAEVINMSWGMDNNLTLRNRILSLMQQNPYIVFVAAAGNDASTHISCPANIPGVITVGATGPDDRMASYTNFGILDICAPGGEGHIGNATALVSTTPQDDSFVYHNPPFSWDSSYEYASGTSMAAPMVSGAVALLKDRFPGISREQIIRRLQGTADDLTFKNTNPTFLTSLGTGRLNVFRALTEADRPAYRLSAVAVVDNGDGILTTGENQAPLRITLKNWWQSGEAVISGILSTQDPYIVINESYGEWESIAYMETGATNDFIISDASPYPRNIRFSLQLSYEGYTDVVYFELPCYPNLVEMFGLEPYRITSEVAVFDMDNDGIDELAFGLKKAVYGGFDYYACLYKNSQLSMVAVNDSIEAKPVFGDLVYGGEYEVVFVTNHVTVYAFNSSMQAISNFPHTFGASGRIKSVVIDDLTGNGQMDIVANGNTHSNGQGFFVLRFQNDYPSNDYEDSAYELPAGVNVLSELAVGNVDHNLDREILTIVKSNTNWVGIAKYRASYIDNKGKFKFEGDISWIIDPGINSISKLRSTNLLLIKPQINASGQNPVYHNRLFFGIAMKYEPGVPRSTSYTTYCYDFSQSNTVAELIWAHVDDSRTPVNQTAPTDIDPGKIIAGDFYPGNFGIELLTNASEEVIDIETGDRIRHLTNDYCPINGGYFHRNRRPALLADVGANNSQDVIVSRNNQLSAYQLNEYPIQSFGMNFYASIRSLAIGSAVYGAIRDLYVLVGEPDTDGVSLYRIPLKSNNIDEADEWTQFQNNERSTAQYLCHIPSLIDTDTTIWQDSVINKDIDIGSGISVGINPGIELRMRNKSIIKNKGTLEFQGGEQHPIVVRGMCPTEINDHWLGVSSGNSSSLIMKETYLSNAEVGLEMYENGFFYLRDNTFQNNGVSNLVYNALVDYGHNKILNSSVGIASYHNAVPYLAWNDTGENIVSGNEIGLYALQSTPYLDEGLNNFVNIQPGQYNIVTNSIVNQIKATVNWWGFTNEALIQETFSDYTDVIYENWCLTPNGNAGKHNTNDYLILAENARSNHDWSLAAQYYYQVLNDSLIMADDFQALKGSTVCHTRMNQIPVFLTWINDKLLSHQTDDEFRKVLLNTKAICSRLVDNFQDAIDHYSAVIDSSPSIIDSSFAFIDMGFAWLESGGNLRSKYASLMPRTTQDQIIRARNILDSLRNPETSQEHIIQPRPIIHSNYPNPFNPSTTIVLSIPQNGRANLSIYNIRGQRVKTLLNGDLEKGQHRVVWNGRDENNRSVASGVYFIRLEAAGKTSIRKAMLLK